MTYQKGDRYHTWFSGREDGMSTIIDVLPYRGKYPQWFSHVLVLSSSNRSGKTEMTVNWENDKEWENSPFHSDWVPKERNLTTHPTRCMAVLAGGVEMALVD